MYLINPAPSKPGAPSASNFINAGRIHNSILNKIEDRESRAIVLSWMIRINMLSSALRVLNNDFGVNNGTVPRKL
jgi:hypothetical protein